MTKPKNDILSTVIGITITIVIVVGLYYLLKKLWSGVHLFGESGNNPFGVPGAGPGTALGAAIAAAQQQGNKPGSVIDNVEHNAGDAVHNLHTTHEAQHTDIGAMAANIAGSAIGKGITSLSDALSGGLAKRLQKANRAAVKYHTKVGADPSIIKTLNDCSQLNDKDFVRVYRDWQKLDGFKDFYATPLANSKISFASINKGAWSRFATRVHALGLA